MTILFKFKSNIKGFFLSSQIKPPKRAEPCIQQANAQPPSQPLKPSDHLHLRTSLKFHVYFTRTKVQFAQPHFLFPYSYYFLQTFQGKIQHPRALEDA